MLTAVEIENLKGISGRQRIEFAALTLLFGANSAGKSTILQALLYLHELIERGAADVDRTELGGHVVELGGFARLVHKHDIEQAIVLRAEFETPGGLDRFGRELDDFPFPDLDDDVESAWLELTVRFRRSAVFRGAVVERAVIGVNGDREPLVWLELGATLRDGEPLNARVNLGHPLLATETRELSAYTVDGDGTQRPITVPHAPADVTAAWESIAIPGPTPDRGLSRSGSRSGSRTHSVSGSRSGPKASSVSGSASGDRDGADAGLGASTGYGGGYTGGAGFGDGTGFGGGYGDGAGLGDGSGFGDARSLPVFAVSRARMSALPAPNEPLRVIPVGDDTPEATAAAQQVRTFLEMVVLGTTAQLASFLRDSPYIGPLRTIPPRGFLYERVGRIASWADGLAAWDLLLADRLTLVERTNTWLRRLQAGCQVVVQELGDGGATAEERAEGHVDKTVRRLLLDTGAGSYVLPSEVGAGVAQLIPVVVAAIEGRGGLALVEQPEIHVHPAVQVGLGDLLIEGAGARRRVAVVETHSEHLLLRVMRRMRETADGALPDGAIAVRPSDVSIVLIEKDGGRTITRKMPLNEKGELVKAWPGGFFEEGLREVL